MKLVLLLVLTAQTAPVSPEIMKKRLATATDNERVHILLDLGRYYAFRDLQQTVEYGEEALANALRLEQNGPRIAAYNLLSRAYNQVDSAATAMAYALDGMAWAELEEDVIGSAACHESVGLVFCRRGAYGEALRWFLAARSLFESLDHEAGLTRIATHLSFVYQALGRLDKAEDLLVPALDKAKTWADRGIEADLLAQMGRVQWQQKAGAEALRYLRRARAMYGQMGHDSGVATCLVLEGRILVEGGDTARADVLFTKARALATRLGHQGLLAACAVGSGMSAERGSNWGEARAHYQRALLLQRDIGNPAEVANCLRLLAQVEGRTGKPDEEHTLLNEALETALSQEQGLASLKLAVAKAERERGVSLLKQKYELERIKAAQDQRSLELRHLEQQLKARTLNRENQVRNTIMLVFGAGLLLSAYLLSRRGNRRQLNQERRLKNQLEDLVAQRTVELVSRCDELETLEGIIQTINQETELPRVLQTMLEQAMLLFPQAERAAFLLWSPIRTRFEVAACVGYAEHTFENVSFSHEEMLARYSAGDTLLPGVVLIENFENLPGDDKLEGMDTPTSLVATAVLLQGKERGFFVLESYTKDTVFHQEDMHRLIRFREHAASAVEKAHNLEELKRINHEILRTQNELITQQKMASLGILSAGIAHEMKNPLNFVNTLTELTADLGQELRENLVNYQKDPTDGNFAMVLEVLGDLEHNGALVNKHGKRANQIVSVMMEMAQGGSVEKRLFSLNALVKEFAQLAYKGMQAKDKDSRIQLDLELDEAVGKIEMAPQNLSRVIINMVNNAFESLTTKTMDRPPGFRPAITLITQSRGDRVALRIRDNGRGIPKDKMAHIWEHFFSTKPSGHGNIGLGLAISYDIVVNEHKGSIAVESEEGEFAEFVITLPLVQRAEPAKLGS